MPSPIFFAWVDSTDNVFNAMVHARYDEEILSVEIDDSEGTFSSLTLEIQNPKVGLLNPSRKIWAWLSWFNGTMIQPLFFGRLIPLPTDLFGEVITLQLLARPIDYPTQLSALVAGLAVLPYYDPLFVSSSTTADGPDATAVLEAYSKALYIDRLTLEVGTTDIISGEDGTLTIDEDEHIYDSVSMSYGAVPLDTIIVDATVNWSQEGNGTVDITRDVCDAAFKAGSPLSADKEMIASLTGDGLVTSWPAAGSSIGGGWTYSASTVATQSTWTDPYALNQQVKWTALIPPNDGLAGGTPQYPISILEPPSAYLSGVFLWGSYEATFPVIAASVTLSLDFAAKRARSEQLQFTMTAAVQPLTSDPDGANVATISVSGTADTTARNSYFLTDRGTQSYEYLLNLGRAKLLNAARTVTIAFETPWLTAINLTLRNNVELIDYRLPGLAATGKVTAINLSYNVGDSAAMVAKITIACTIGTGDALSPIPGTGVYAAPGYMQAGYQQQEGAYIDLIGGVLLAEVLTDFALTDDGIDLTNFDKTIITDTIVIENGLDSQQAAILAESKAYPNPDPPAKLQTIPTKIDFSVPDLTSGSFLTVFTPTILPFQVPKTIDLGA